MSLTNSINNLSRSSSFANPIEHRDNGPSEGSSSSGRTVKLAESSGSPSRAPASSSSRSVAPLGERQVALPKNGGRADAPAKAQPTEADRIASRVNTLINAIEADPSNKNNQAARAVVQAIGGAIELVSQAPVGKAETQSYLDEIKSFKEVLRLTLEDLDGGPKGKEKADDAFDLRDVLADTVGDVQQSLDARADAVREIVDNNPLSEAAVFRSKSYTTEGASLILDREIARIQNAVVKENRAPTTAEAHAITVLQNASDTLADRTQAMRTGRSNEPIAMDRMQELMGSKKTNHGIGAGRMDALKGAFGAADIQRIGGDKINAKASDFAGRIDFGALGRGQLAPGAIPMHMEGVREEGMMTVFLAKTYETAGLDVPKLGTFEKQLAGARSQSLNSAEWNVIEKKVQLQNGGATFHLDSTITPQSQLGETFADMKKGGLNCHMAQAYDHCANVAVTSAKVGDKVLFEGVRHGTLTPYQISGDKLAKMDRAALTEMVEALLPRENWKASGDGPARSLLHRLQGKHAGEASAQATVDRMMNSKSFRNEAAKTMRAEATYRRAMDVATAALVNDLAQNANLLDRAERGETVPVNISSISLLTPDAVRGTLGVGGADERLMLSDQFAGWAKASNGERTITIRHPTTNEEMEVKVQIKALAFNFGVNKGAVNSLGGPVKPSGTLGAVLSGWTMADQQNATSINALIGTKAERSGGPGGQVGEWLRNARAQGSTVSSQDVRTVEDLASQVGDIWDTQSYRSQGGEPYKIVSRLALLTDMIGNTACWNCKSGKDRTGECDTETKYLAAQIHMTGTVPVPDRVRSTEERNNLFRVATEGGNHEMQALNTGAPGYKLGGVPVLGQLIGETVKDARFAQFSAMSRFYGS